jgi:hypothetical protein
VPTEKLPLLCLTFQAREGVEMVVVVCRQRKYPSVSCFERGRGVEGVCQQRTPPSHNLSEGGVGGDASIEEPPSSHVLSERGGVEVLTEKLPPSVSCFGRGRGWRWWWCVDRKTTPLRLAFRAREGVVVVVVVVVC